MRSGSADNNIEMQLLARLKQGDNAAFSEIYDNYASDLISFASAKLFSLEAARDLIHDLFVYIWANRESIEVNKNLQSYLYNAVRNKIVDHIRKNVVREHHAANFKVTFIESHDDLEKSLEAKDLKNHLNNVIEGFSPRLKTIYMLSKNEHHNISEIARMLSLSEQTVKNQLSTALKYLRNAMTKLSVLIAICLFLK